MTRRSGSSPRRLPPRMSVLRRRVPLCIDWLDVDGVRLRYGLREGPGRPLVVLNTLGAGLESLRPFVDALDERELILPEAPGAGRSPARMLPRGMRWHARLLARLLDRLGYTGRLDILGLGWGGALAQAFALAYPARTNRLILAATSVGTLYTSWNTRSARQLQAVLTHAQGDHRPAAVLSALIPRLLSRQTDVPAGHSHAARVDPSARGYFNQALAGLGFVSLHRLHHLMCPTLIMGGDEDPVAPLVNSRLLYWLIPKSQLHVIRAGGHLFLLLRAHESAAVIQRFLAERRYDGTDPSDYAPGPGPVIDGRPIPPPLPDPDESLGSAGA